MESFYLLLRNVMASATYFKTRYSIVIYTQEANNKLKRKLKFMKVSSLYIQTTLS